MVIPPLVKKGDRVALCASSFAPFPDAVANCAAFYTSLGCVVELKYNPAEHHFNFAATDEQRLEHLQAALDDPGIVAIQFIRGGYGLSRIIDRIDFSGFVKYPKWLIGFSDVTLLMLAATKLGVACVHGPMGSHLVAHNPGVDALAGLLTNYTYNVQTPCSGANIDVVGPVTGGNVTLLAHSIGGPFQPNLANCVLLLEEVNEQYYHLDRMCLQLSAVSHLQQVACILGGHFTQMLGGHSQIGETEVEILSHRFKAPVISGFPAGHAMPNFPLLIGPNLHLQVRKNQLSLKLAEQTI